jgi:Response regulator of the LytR/AlgR family
MNPFDENRKSYIAACFALAVIYAFIIGGFFSLENLDSLSISNMERSATVSADCWQASETGKFVFCLADGLIYGVILYLMGIILWNIFRFAIPANYTPKYRLFFVSILAILTALIITGAESFAVYLCFPSMFDNFATTIPLRLFFSLLIFVIIRLFYLFYFEKQFHFKEETDWESDVKIEATIHNGLDENEKTTIPSIDRITVRSGQSIKIIPIEDITFIKADGDYISINTPSGYWLKEQTMKFTEDSLPADRFARIHRSYIVNVNHISRIERYGEQQQVVLHNNEKIKISAARYQVLKQLLGI